MKKIFILTAVFITSVFGLTTYLSSCKQDPCVTRNVVCNNGGTCHDGDCVCAAGYEGDSCQFTVNKKYDSYYACIRKELINNVQDNDNDDTLRLVPGADKYSLKMYSIRDSVYEVIDAVVDGSYITIKEQNKEFLNYIYKYSGTGNLTSNVLTITLYKQLIQPTNITWSSKVTYVGYKY